MQNQQSGKQPKNEVQGAGNNNKKGAAAAAAHAEQVKNEANDNSNNALKNQSKKLQAQADDNQNNKKKGSSQITKSKKGGSSDPPPNADDSNQGDENAGGQATSVAGGRSQSEVAMSHGFSNYTLYKILEGGGRITRNTIRKEHEPAMANAAAGSQTTQKQERQKQDEQIRNQIQIANIQQEQAKITQQPKDMRKLQKKQQQSKSQVSQSQRPAQSSGQAQRDDANQKLKMQQGVSKQQAHSTASRGGKPEASGAIQKDETSQGGDAHMPQVGDSPGSSGDSKQTGQKVAPSKQKTTTRKLYERKDIVGHIGMKTQSMQIHGSGQSVTMINRAQRPSPPKMGGKHQSLIMPSSGAKGNQPQDKQQVGGQTQKNAGKSSVSNNNWKQNTDIVAGQDAMTPIDQADFKTIDNQRDQATSNKQANLNKRDEKAQSKTSKKHDKFVYQHANQGQPSQKNDQQNEHQQSGRQQESQDMAANKETSKTHEAKQRDSAQPGTNQKVSQLTKRQGPTLNDEVQPNLKRGGPHPSSPSHQDKVNSANQANQGGSQSKNQQQSAAKGAESSPEVKERQGSRTASTQISGKKGKPAVVTGSNQKKVGGQNDQIQNQQDPNMQKQPGGGSQQWQSKVKQGGSNVGTSKSGAVGTKEEAVPSGKQPSQNQPNDGSRNPKRPQHGGNDASNASRAQSHRFSKQDEQMLFNDVVIPAKGTESTKKERPSGEKATKNERMSSPNAQAIKRSSETGNSSAATAKMQHLEQSSQRDKNQSRSTSPNKTGQAQKQQVKDNEAPRDQDAEMSVLQLDFRAQQPQPPVSGQQRRPDKKRHSMEKYVLDRHLEMKDKFEQHFPHYLYVDNRLVLYGEGSAQIESVNAPLTSRGSSNRQAPHGSVSGPTDYEKIVAHVKIYADNPSIPMKFKLLKYLGRVYTCDIKFLCPVNPDDDDDELPGEILENLVDDYQTRSGSNHVLIVQVIDDSNRYHVGRPRLSSQGTIAGNQSPGSSEGVKSNTQEPGPKFSTHHPMRFYFIGKDEFDDRLIMQPVTFKNLLSEKEAAELMILQDREREMEGQAGQLAEQSKQRIRELSEKFDYLRDLQLFEDEMIQAQRGAETVSPEPQWAYKPEIVQFVKTEAQNVVRRFNEYKDKMSRVVVTEQNMHNSLFTLCLFDNNENQRSKGVLMQVKYDNHKKNYLLQFRHIQMKQDQKEKFEWVALTTAQLSDHCKNQIHLLQPAPSVSGAPERYYHVTSEYFRGFVSLDYLKSLDNTYETGTRLRSKLLQLISHEASLLQVQKQLNIIVFPSKEQVIAQEREKESQNQMAQLEVESKVSVHTKLSQAGGLTGRSEEASLQVFSRREQPQVKQSQLHQQTNSNLICKKCNYQREGFGLLSCSECHDAWHVQCLEDEYQQHLGVAEKQWRCPNCIRCTNCKSMVGNKKLMLVCRTCNSPYHYDCLDQSVKLSIPQIVNDNNQKWRKELRQRAGQNAPKQQQELKELIKFEYQCQNCIQCAGCGTTEAGPSRQSKWSRDFQFCSPCNRKRRANQYCKICYENWPAVDPNLPPSQEDLLKANMIKCFTCNLWIHVKCDLIMLNDQIQKQLIQSQRQSSFSKAYEPRLQYCCPDCRAQKRMEYVKTIVKEIQAEDKNGFFTHEFWEEYDPPTKQQYLRQIKNPMCFEIIFKRLEELYYIYNALQLRIDLQQIFRNAKDYNRPHQLVYKDALRLHDLCLSKISSHYPYLQRQTFAQEKEDLYRKLIHLSPDFQRRFLRILYPTVAERQDLENERERLLAFQEKELPRFVVGEADDQNQLIQDATSAIELGQALEGDNDDVQLPYLSCFIEEEHIPMGLVGNISGSGGAGGGQVDDIGGPSSRAINTTNPAGVNQANPNMSAPPKQVGGSIVTDKLRKNNSLKEQYSEPLSGGASGSGKIGNANMLSTLPQPRTRQALNRVRYDERGQAYPMKSNSTILVSKLNTQDIRPALNETSAPNEPLNSGRGPNQNQDGHTSPALASNTGLLKKRFAQGEIDEVVDQDRLGTKRQNTEDRQQRFEENFTKMMESQQQSALNEQRENRQQSARGGADTLSNKATSRGGNKNERNEGYSASGANSIFNPNNYPNKEKSRKLMMERYQKEDDEGCYYCNPIHCSFDDPLLIFEEMCYLCGSFGNQEDFVTCILCCESFHTYCLQLPSSDIQGMYQSNWKCLNCKSCERCGKATDEDLLMFCGVCDRPYHSFCLKPEIKHLPQAWKCEHCFNCKQCGTRQYYNEEDVRNGVNLTNDDYSLSKNFSLCHQCGQNEYKKQSCSICQEKTTPDMNRKGETMKCRDCGFYSHIACSRVSYEELYMLLLEFNEQNPDSAAQYKSVESVYKCLDCMMKGKSVNFLILESCLHYENIHSLIMRQQFISDICIEILFGYFPEQFRMKAPKFIQKFITQNQDFFRSDDVIIKWIELMEREVNFENVVSRTPKDGDNKQDDEVDKAVQLPKGHWKKYNPFEPSQFMSSDGKSKNLLKDLEAQPLMAPTNSAMQARHAQVLASLEHKYDYQKLLCGVKNDKVTQAMRIENSMNCFKRSMLPEKRSMYESLYKQTLNRYSLSGQGNTNGYGQQQPQIAQPLILDKESLILDQQESVVTQSQGIQGQQCRKMYVDQDEMERILCPTQEKKDKFINRLVNGIEDDEELSSEYDSESSSRDDEFQNSYRPDQTADAKQEIEKDEVEDGQIVAVPQSKSRSLVELYVQYELKAVMRIKLQFFKWFEEFFAKTMNVFLGQSNGQNQQQQTERQAQITQNQIQDDSSVESYQDFDCSDSRSVDSMVLCPKDQPIDNPQKLLTCLLCKQKGEYTVTGRLIPYKLNMYVHTSCAIWTDEVFDIEDQQIVNFYQQQKKLQGQKCAICNDYGATLSCSRSKGCNKHYHFPCAYRSGRVRFNRHKEVFCESCVGSRGQSTAIPISNVSHGVGSNTGLLGTRGAGTQGGTSGALALADEQVKGSRNMFPYEYLKKRRLYIVQNTKEINQQEYENEMENQMLNDEKEKKNSRGEKESHKGGGKGDKSKKNDKNNDAASNQNNNQGSQKEIDLDKWRPFYFDLFNRVGNLTVLSLRKEVNQLIDIVQKDNSASGINNIQAYIQQQQLLYSEKQQNSQNASKSKDFESPVRKLSRPGAAGSVSYNQGGNTGSLMEDLRKYLDLFNDYATIRIYWKFYDDKRMQKPATGNDDPRKLKKAYFLFMNKSKRIIELEKNDLRTVMEYCAQQISTNFIVQSHVNTYLRESSQLTIPHKQTNFDVIDQDMFWSKILDHFRGQRGNFSLQNIEFCVEKLFGLAKYPINVWNQLELTNHDLKYNLNTQKSRLSFFLKSAISVFHATTANSAGYPHPYNLSGIGNAPANANSGGQKDKAGTTLDPKTLLNGRVLSLDGVFQRMIKVNNMDKYEYDIVHSNYYKKLQQQQSSGQVAPMSSRFAYRPGGTTDRDRQWAQHHGQGAGASAGLSGSSSVVHGGMGHGHGGNAGLASLVSANKSGAGMLLGSGVPIEYNINQMDQLSVNNLSSKHMTMNQLLTAMGRGHKVDIGKISKILEGQKTSKQNRKLQQSKGLQDQDIESLERSEIRARKRVLESKQHLQHINLMSQAQQQQAELTATQLNSQNVNKVNKINLPLAMLYRSSLQLPPKVEVGPSKIHRIGLFTLEDLKPLDIVIEYVGEIIRHEVADLREKRYIEKGIGDCYMFTIDDQHIIDATFFGGKARYLNHSCDANCSAKIITVDNQKHIIIRAKKHITAGSELTYNYNFDQEEDQMSCLCGAKNCQGYLA